MTHYEDLKAASITSAALAEFWLVNKNVCSIDCFIIMFTCSVLHVSAVAGNVTGAGGCLAGDFFGGFGGFGGLISLFRVSSEWDELLPRDLWRSRPSLQKLGRKTTQHRPQI